MIFQRSLLIVSLVLAFMFALSTPSFAEQVVYSYDDTGQLIRAQYGDGTIIVYSYDGLGNRLVKTVTLAGEPANNPWSDEHILACGE